MCYLIKKTQIFQPSTDRQVVVDVAAAEIVVCMANFQEVRVVTEDIFVVEVVEWLVNKVLKDAIK
jgi:hypothetical protein